MEPAKLDGRQLGCIDLFLFFLLLSFVFFSSFFLLDAWFSAFADEAPPPRSTPKDEPAEHKKSETSKLKEKCNFHKENGRVSKGRKSSIILIIFIMLLFSYKITYSEDNKFNYDQQKKYLLKKNYY